MKTPPPMYLPPSNGRWRCSRLGGASDGESLQRFHERSAGLPVWWCVVRPPELSIAALRRFLRQCYAGGCFHDPSPLPQHSTMTFKASAQLRPPTVQPAAFTHSCPSASLSRGLPYYDTRSERSLLLYPVGPGAQGLHRPRGLPPTPTAGGGEEFPVEAQR
ncbi:hypothetical protein KC359_g41 [Hortaea werneckii]|nr:hypothetical protein KC359_g41 [Hortaea werneckii]